MAITELTLDEYCTLKILEHRNNVRERLANYKSVLEDAGSDVWTSALLAACDLEVSVVYKMIIDDLGRYSSIDTDANNLYASYSTSGWKSDLDSDVSGLTTLKNTMKSAFDNNFMAINPSDKYLIMQLNSTQKTQFANAIGTALG